MSEYNSVYALGENLYMKNAPVSLVSGGLFANSENGKLRIQLKFKNLQGKKIETLKTELVLMDVAGKTVGKMNFSVKVGAPFERTLKLFINRDVVRKFSCKVTEVCFENGEIWTPSVNDNWAPMSQVQALPSEQKSGEAIEECKLEVAETQKVEENIVEQPAETIQNEDRKLTVEKPKKTKKLCVNRKKTFIVAVACAVVISAVSSFFVIRDVRYNKAQAYVGQCRYEEAIEILQGLSGYKDADQLYEYIWYMQNENYAGWIIKNNLTEFSVPHGVTEIPNNAFNGCVDLTKVTIPNTVAKIGTDAFKGCIGLTKIVIPDGVTSIGAWAFYECTSLAEIVFPDSVTSIGSYAFYGCSALRDIRFDGTMQQWNNMKKGVWWSYNVSTAYVICTDGKVSL